jgi:membrane protein DedA with SNARE-associated domain
MTSFLTNLITSYGYVIVAVVVGLESLGIPLPGETTLILAAVYAGSSHRLSIPLVILAAAAGAIVGDNLGYQIGRIGGYRFLRRYGQLVRLDESGMKVGEYLFQRYGGRVVFLGRFTPILRILAAVLAGTDRMPWRRFVVANAAGGILWAIAIGLLGYVLGANVSGPLSYAGYGLAVLATAIGWLLLRRFLPQLQAQAEAALPGPLDDCHRREGKDTRGRRAS